MLEHDLVTYLTPLDPQMKRMTEHYINGRSTSDMVFLVRARFKRLGIKYNSIEVGYHVPTDTERLFIRGKNDYWFEYDKFFENITDEHLYLLFS